MVCGGVVECVVVVLVGVLGAAVLWVRCSSRVVYAVSLRVKAVARSSAEEPPARVRSKRMVSMAPVVGLYR